MASPRSPLRAWLLVLATVALWPALGSSAGAQEPDGATVLVTTLAEPITPVIADHLADGIRQAARDGHQAYIIELDTPGGLEVSMRQIVQDILASPVPVVVHITPPGARGASAGAVIALAAHVAAMSPGTTIGAATPVAMDGGEIQDKVLEDASAYVEELARLRGRDQDLAVAMVREGRAVTAEQALAAGTVEVLAEDRRDLLDQLAGREVALSGGAVVTLAPADAVAEHHMPWTRRVLQWLADPTIAFLLLSIGTLGVIYELASPGVGVGGVIGVVAIVLALFSLAVLPVNVVGVVFLLVAAALFVAELFAPGVGVAAAGGAVMLVLSALFLFDEEAPGVELSLAAVLPTALVLFGLVTLAGRLALRARAEPPLADQELVGEVAEVRRHGDRAQAFVGGAWWAVHAPATPLRDGQPVRVLARHELELLVEPLDQRSEPTPIADLQANADEGRPT